VLGSIGHFSSWVTAPHSNTESRFLLYNAERPERRRLMETPHLIQDTERDSSPWQPPPQRSPYHNATTGAVYQEILVHFRFFGGATEEARERKNSFYCNEVKVKCVGWCWCQERTAGITVLLVILSFRFPLETVFVYYKWFCICLSRYVLETDMPCYTLQARCCLIQLQVPPSVCYFIACYMEGELY